MKKKEKFSNGQILAIAAIAILFAVVLYNSYRIMNLATDTEGGVSLATDTEGGVSSSYSKIIPKGIPDIYGKELDVSFDDISALTPQKADSTINILGNLDNGINLEGNDLERYIKIASEISCEYCCGAASIIFSNGQAACGCAHSYAMRGLAKYIIKNHPSEFTDSQILEELGKWKVLFFPEIHMQKASILDSKGVELNYINLASNKYRGIEKGASGGMVGGC